MDKSFNMKKTQILPGAFLCALFFSGCISDNSNSSKEEQQETKVSHCTYSYDPAFTSVGWIAYKFNERTGVKGQFTAIEVSGHQTAEKQVEVFKNASFEIPVSSLQTGDVSRDGKIRDFFFGTLENSSVIHGKVVDLKEEGDGQTGTFVLDFSLNNREEKLELDYLLNGDSLILSGVLNTDTWNAQKGIARLNQECNDLHKGADGISKLWPDIKVEIRTLLPKKCN
jgi:polyisoprenoid-binding protein YceI